MFFPIFLVLSTVNMATMPGVADTVMKGNNYVLMFGREKA